ncbi:uncharacterized protein LOC103467890 [Poecilia reticulata]|uniref:Uncharacterized LOC103467890 n=1 Tax=Poecilia reticulata TaxID=8081 RepID=A0A3P9Q802_POERE|nr:PREDICTED: uncharacterized protein LOC103467890 [Poecilia reticulata]XP_017161103.1 PREDICTED: uncharacterized protein LOC103467890 [Poecilia reticulata]
MSDTFDHPGNTYTESTYGPADKFANGPKNKPEKHIPKAGVHAEAGVDKPRAERRIFKAKGPKYSTGTSITLLGSSAFAQANLGSASVATGPVKVRACLPSADISADSAELLEVIDTYDRPGDAYTEDTYARAGTYAIEGGEDKPGKRVPKAGAYAEAGVGKARAEWSVFEAEAKGPNASAGAGANPLNVSAIARAELASASAAAGPVKIKVGLAADTGVSVGAHGLEAKVLGTGVTIGPKLGVSVLGNGIECCLS